MTVKSSNAYADLIKQAADRAKVTTDDSTHVERRELGWRRFNVMLPPETHRAFKLQCIRDDMEMGDVARALIESWLEARRRKVEGPGLYDE